MIVARDYCAHNPMAKSDVYMLIGDLLERDVDIDIRAFGEGPGEPSPLLGGIDVSGPLPEHLKKELCDRLYEPGVYLGGFSVSGPLSSYLASIVSLIGVMEDPEKGLDCSENEMEWLTMHRENCLNHMTPEELAIIDRYVGLFIPESGRGKTIIKIAELVNYIDDFNNNRARLPEDRIKLPDWKDVS